MTVACLASLLLKERLGKKRAAAIAVGFAGVVIAVNPFSAFQQNEMGLAYLALFCNMLCASGQMLLLRAVAEHEKSECTSFYPRAVLVVAGAFSCATTGFVALNPWLFLSLCLQGALGGLGWALMAQAYKNAPAAAVSPFQYSQMITGALLGYLMWGDVPNSHLWAGAAIIVLSGIFLVRHERRISRMTTRVE
jgi:drug/metabolite transporter (DMT)-like permease